MKKEEFIRAMVDHSIDMEGANILSHDFLSDIYDEINPAVEYKFSMSKVLITGLHKLDKAGGTGKLFNLPMTKGELVNFARIRFWGFAINDKEGVWQITQKGKDFLEGKISCKKFCFIKNNRFQNWGEKDIFVSDVKKIEDIREYYQEQARKQKGYPDLFGKCDND